ncbi:ABC transporter permease, partial [candidate division KSB1 bacterium]|nr:ABC transporter permease [candidate division KSB1 bacterium]
MLINYLKIIIRFLKKQKLYSFINIAGLAIGVACTLFIVMWMFEELSYDHFYQNADDIYRVEQKLLNPPDGIIPIALTPTPLAPILKDRYPEILETARIHYMKNMICSHENKRFVEDRILAV